MTFQVKKTEKHSWQTSTSNKLGIKASSKIKIPLVGDFGIEVSGEFTEAAEGKEIITEETMTYSFPVTIPKMTIMVVLATVKNETLVLVPAVQNEIANHYVADMVKYATAADTVKIRSCFNSIPAQLAKENKKFQYKVVQRGGSAALFGEAIEWLAQAGIVLKCQKIDHGTSPIAVYADLSSFKLYMSDIGLLVMRAGVPQQTILTGESNLFMGSVAENYVAQSLAANGHSLFYWASEHTAELDFVLQKETEIIGIEVKKGVKVHSKSLSVFISKYKPNYSIRFSEKNFGKVENQLSVPLYAVFCV